MTRSDIDMCVRAGADAVGFVTEYPVAVPWNIGRDKARELAAAVPPFVTTTAVVGGPVETILQIAQAVRPNLLQLHGDETAEEIGRICAALRNTATKVVKALRIDVDTGRARFAIEDPLAAALALAASGIAALVIDSKTARRPAGTGIPLDWHIAAQIAAALPIPLILAGGLTVQNVAAAVAQVRPFGVDVISGVEKAAGIKDEALIAQFVRAAKTAGRESNCR